MRFAVNCSLLSLSLCVSALARAAPMTLNEVFQRAAARSEALSQARLDILRQEREIDRARSLGGSRVRLQTGVDAQENHTQGREPSWKAALKPNLQTEWRYPLYDGGSAQSQVEAGRRVLEAENWDLAERRELLFLECARVFYEIVGHEQDIKNLKESESIYRDRVETLSQRARIGRSRSAEVLAARTQLQVLRSQIAAASNNKHIAEQRLIWLADSPPPLELRDSLPIDELSPKQRPPVERTAPLPTVEAAKARVAAAQVRLESGEAARRPQLDFIAAHRWNFPNDDSVNNFSIGLGLNWLLYDAGENRAAVAGLALERQQAAINQQLLSREAALSQALAQSVWQDGMIQLQDLEQAYKAAELNLQAQQREFENGLLTNLELMQALDTRLQVKRTLDQTVYRTKFAYIESQLRRGQIKINTETKAEMDTETKASLQPAR